MPLGADVGRDIRPGADVPQGLFCDQGKEKRQTPVTAGYNTQWPMSKFTPGQTIVQTWPAKNHATVGTQRGVQLFIGDGPGLGDVFTKITTKEAWLAKYPKLTHTFSNCNPPGPNIDRAECKGTFEVPTDLTPGIYTFMWWWEFNGGEFYNTCYDVEIVAQTSNPNPTANPTPIAPTMNPNVPTTSESPSLCPPPDNVSPGPATPAGTCTCAKSTTWDGNFGQYAAGKDFCGQGFGQNNPYICAGGAANGGNVQVCKADSCAANGEFTFSDEQGWRIKVDNIGTANPYRAFTFVQFCNGQEPQQCWKTPMVTFSFSFKTTGLATMSSYVKLFFWTDGGNMLGLLPPNHPNAGGQYKLITFPQDDRPNTWKKDMAIQDNSWYNVKVIFTPETSGVRLEINGNVLDESTITAANMKTDKNGPQLGVYLFPINNEKPSFSLWIHDTCVGESSGTCPSMGMGGRRLYNHDEFIPCPAPSPVMQGEYPALTSSGGAAGAAEVAAASTSHSLASMFLILIICVQHLRQ